MKTFSFFFVLIIFFVACEKEVPVGEVSLSETSLTLFVGESETLKGIITPSNATHQTVTWMSTNPTVAVVTDDGEVTAISEGVAVIIATAGGKTAICDIVVTSDPIIPTVPVTGISLNETELTLTPGESKTLTVAITPDDIKAVTWMSTNPTVAVVTADGEVTAISEGVAVIIATAGGKSVICNVTVSKSIIPATKQMTLVLNEHSKSKNISISMRGSGIINIDWGDGSPVEKHTLTEGLSYNPPSFGHFYYIGNCTITIIGDHISELICKNIDNSSSTKGLSLFILDVSKNDVLKKLTCRNNGYLKKIDVSANTLLEFFDCGANRLPSIDVRNNPNLTYLNCALNDITSLDVNNNTKLRQLICYNNQLKTLDITNLADLNHLDCSWNKLTELYLSQVNNEISFINCEVNLLSSNVLDALFGMLPQKSGAIIIRNNPGENDCDISIATKKGWKINDAF